MERETGSSLKQEEKYGAKKGHRRSVTEFLLPERCSPPLHNQESYIVLKLGLKKKDSEERRNRLKKKF